MLENLTEAREDKLNEIKYRKKLKYNEVVNDTITISPDELFIEIKGRINQLSEKSRDNLKEVILL